MNADVTVVMPHFNALVTVRESILSVLAQTLPVRELIIVDDASDDVGGLLVIVAEFRQRLPISVISLASNMGAGHARSEAVGVAAGKYLAFLDADDVWHPEKIAVQYSAMERTGLRISGHRYVHDLRRQPMDGVVAGPATSVPIFRFVHGNPFYTPTVMVLREGFICFDPRYRRLDDYKCWLMNVKVSGGSMIPAALAGGFKPAIGASGLTSSFRVMHRAFVDILHDLYREGVIGLPFLVTARIIEHVKFPLRVLKSKFLA